MKRSHVLQLRPYTAEKTKILTDLTFLRSTLTRTKLTVLTCDSGALSSHPLSICSWLWCQSETQPVREDKQPSWRMSFIQQCFDAIRNQASKLYWHHSTRGLPEEGWLGGICPVCSPGWKPPTGWATVPLWWRTLSFISLILRDCEPSSSCHWNTC